MVLLRILASIIPGSWHLPVLAAVFSLVVGTLVALQDDSPRAFLAAVLASALWSGIAWVKYTREA